MFIACKVPEVKTLTKEDVQSLLFLFFCQKANKHSDFFFQGNVNSITKLDFSNLSLEIFFTFQETYCEDLPFNCPTKANFDYFDADGNGILTWSEWKSLHG